MRHDIVVCSNAKHLSDCGIKSTIKIDFNRFPDGELSVKINEDKKIENVIVVQSLSNSDGIIEFLLTIDALKRLNSKKIIGFIAYYGYARQDRCDEKGKAISAKVIANLLDNSGIDIVYTLDLHSLHIEGFFSKVNCFNILPIKYILKFLKLNEIKDRIAFIAPDAGALIKTQKFLNHAKLIYPNNTFDDNPIVINKLRNAPGDSKVINIDGSPKDKLCIIFDDIIDSGGTICNAANTISDMGSKEIWVCITHGILGDNAIEKINNSNIKRVLISPSRSEFMDKLKNNTNNEKIEILDIIKDIVDNEVQ